MEGNICRICLKGNSIPLKITEEAGLSETLLKRYIPEIKRDTKGLISLCDQCLTTISAFDDLRRTAVGTEEKIEEYLENSVVTETNMVDLQDFKQKQFSCSTCKVYFNDSVLYAAHVLTHTIEKRFPCNYCDKSFATGNNLQKHIQNIHNNHNSSNSNIEIQISVNSNTNSNSEVFKCNVCHRRFPTEKLMKKHRTSAHTEKGKHVCKNCRATFSSVLSKRRHYLRCMDKIDPIICPQCRKGFFSNWNFKRHVRLVHEAKIVNSIVEVVQQKPLIQCCICNMELYGTEEVINHLKDAHSDLNVCPICFKKFAHRYNVKRHILNLHKTEVKIKEEENLVIKEEVFSV